jgi:hypothetical protein
MRYIHSTIAPAEVHHLAQQKLASCLNWQAFRQSVTVAQLLDLLLVMAATARTLFAIVRRRFTFSHETARQAVLANLPELDALTRGLVDALHSVPCFRARDRRRRWTVAIDTHYDPFYGKRATPHTVGGQKKQGTKYFFGYASLMLIHKRHRYTLGLIAMTESLKPHQIVNSLLEQLRCRGLQVGGVVLDSGFESGETILLLQRLGLSYTVPLRRKGKGSNRRNACFSWAPGTVGQVNWVTEKTREAVETSVLVWNRTKREGGQGTKVYAVGGWKASQAQNQCRRAWLARRHYRERFGIETSYRQKNQAHAWTTSTNVVYRFLLEGLSHLLRQIWVWLTAQIAKAQHLKPTAWVEALPLREMLEFLADYLKAMYELPAPSRCRIGA